MKDRAKVMQVCPRCGQTNFGGPFWLRRHMSSAHKGAANETRPAEKDEVLALAEKWGCQPPKKGAKRP